MREIKFRFWIKEKEVMVQDVRIHGKLNSKLNQQWLVPMQFTGLKDKNGKEIYEDDLIRVADDIYIAKVMFSYDSWRPDVYQRKTLSEWIRSRSRAMGGEGVEVIGNIYQNPELLNEE